MGISTGSEKYENGSYATGIGRICSLEYMRHLEYTKFLAVTKEVLRGIGRFITEGERNMTVNMITDHSRCHHSNA